MCRVLNFLKIEKATLFGGSWGSTISLLFGIWYPERVKGMVLRGIFTGSSKERKNHLDGELRKFFPNIWKRYIKHVPKEQKKSPTEYYYENIVDPECQKLKKKLSFELVFYGSAIAKIDEYAHEAIEKKVKDSDYINKARILSHYSMKDFFIKDGFIMDNLDKLTDIPIRIVQGRFDMITPPRMAIKLDKQLPHSDLYLVQGGHSPHEPEMKKQLQTVMKEMLNEK